MNEKLLNNLGINKQGNLVYSIETSRQSRNHYNITERDVFCATCGNKIGHQIAYTDFNHPFKYHTEDENPQRDKDEYKFCPYCGTKFENE